MCVLGEWVATPSLQEEQRKWSAGPWRLCSCPRAVQSIPAMGNSFALDPLGSPVPKSLFALVPLGLEQPDCPGGPSPGRQEEAVPASSALDCQVVYFCPSILSFSCMGASPYRSVAPPLPAVHLVPGNKQSPGGWSWDGWGSFCQVEALGLNPPPFLLPDTIDLTWLWIHSELSILHSVFSMPIHCLCKEL